MNRAAPFPLRGLVRAAALAGAVGLGLAGSTRPAEAQRRAGPSQPLPPLPSAEQLNKQLDAMKEARGGERERVTAQWADHPRDAGEGEDPGRARVEFAHEGNRWVTLWELKPGAGTEDRLVRFSLAPGQSEALEVAGGDWELRLAVGQPGEAWLALDPRPVRVRAGQGYRAAFVKDLDKFVTQRWAEQRRLRLTHIKELQESNSPEGLPREEDPAKGDERNAKEPK